MSALATPLVHTLASDADIALVNAEFIMSMGKTDRPPRTENGKPVYSIDFKVLATDGQIKDVNWLYTDNEAQRNTDFDAVVAAISTAI